MAPGCFSNSKTPSRVRTYHFVILGQRHFDHLVAEWLEHYHTERPHQSLDNELLKRPTQCGQRPMEHFAPINEQVESLAEVRCKERLGGLLKSYSRKAA